MIQMGHDSPRAAMIYQHPPMQPTNWSQTGCLLIEQTVILTTRGTGGTNDEEPDAFRDRSLPHTMDELR